MGCRHGGLTSLQLPSQFYVYGRRWSATLTSSRARSLAGHANGSRARGVERNCEGAVLSAGQVREVLLVRRTPEVWRRYPKKIRSALLDGTAQIRKIRHEIALAAKVQSMPLIRVYDEIWADLEKASWAHGRATLLPVGDLSWAGVEIPAPTAVCGDEAAIRAVLVHEFAHCFHFQRLIVDGIDAGRHSIDVRSPTGDVLADGVDHDDSMLENPEDWFGEDDARLFLRWEDSRLEIIEKRGLELELIKHLPIESPHQAFRADHHAVPRDIWEHVRRLRSEPGNFH